jgi:hypothetical protein
LRHTLSHDKGGHRDILERREFREKMMELENEPDLLVPELCDLVVIHCEDIGFIIEHSSGCWTIEGSHNVQQSALSRTGRANNSEYLSSVKPKVDATKNKQSSLLLLTYDERLGEILDPDDWFLCLFLRHGFTPTELP